MSHDAGSTNVLQDFRRDASHGYRPVVSGFDLGPFLWTGVTYAFVQSLGTLPSDREVLKYQRGLGRFLSEVP